nr:probable E3 ubiquitin ligase SUD1 isoform X2 [Ipomoea batatas]GME11003.1 probable E3 ubiquitin ligase SUD1 isoform X2 [Ipomoea batatas]
MLPDAANKNSGATGSAFKYDDDEEEEDVCRICRNPGDADNPLRYPCACSGSIKYVHQDCLLQWLNHSNARQCEVSLESFLSLYADVHLYYYSVPYMYLAVCICTNASTI